MRLLLFPDPLLVVALAGAQMPPDPAAIENTGKPMRVPFACTQDDIRACRPDVSAGVTLARSTSSWRFQPVGNTTFLAGNLHTDTATLSSILLATSDGGKTWHEPYARMRMAGLDLIQFVDFETGWISGQALSSVASRSVPSADARRRQDLVSRPVFSESREGAIDYFHFDSKTHGMLWIDRSQSGETGDLYESYEADDRRRELDERARQAAAATGRAPGRPQRRNGVSKPTPPRSRTGSSGAPERDGRRWRPSWSVRVIAGKRRSSSLPNRTLSSPGPAQATPPVPAAPASTTAPGIKKPFSWSSGAVAERRASDSLS